MDTNGSTRRGPRHVVGRTESDRLARTIRLKLAAGRALTMLALQSDRYRDDSEYRAAVDTLLASIAKAEGGAS